MKKLSSPARTAKPATDRARTVARTVEAPRSIASDRLAVVTGGVVAKVDNWDM